MDGRVTGKSYACPRIRDYGDLVSLTADSGVMLHMGIGQAGLVGASAPNGSGGPGGRAVTAQNPGGDLVGGGDGPGGTLSDASGGDGGGGGGPSGAGGAPSGGGGGAGGGGGGGGGGDLPFTGFVASMVGAVGAGMTAAGVALRKALRREAS